MSLSRCRILTFTLQEKVKAKTSGLRFQGEEDIVQLSPDAFVLAFSSR